MNDKAFFDTNVLIYAFAQNDPRAEPAEALLAAGGIVSVQVLNEFVAVATRKLGMPWKDVLEALSAIRVLCPAPLPLTVETHEAALGIAAKYRYHIYDALVIAAALESACATLYSEDLHDGQTIDRLAIRNPFKRLA
jgi:predicted nucleic acid-binding protein